ncbi:uncharacterized protein VTP21DRAFT_4071 [Calcarisporiella thermophila]|uniref:uncharacterized protein n=1 Tax=Calcarisporiella thermophila TaxID=911321 RepID=UPI003742577F
MEAFQHGVTSKAYPLSPLDIIPNHLYITNVYFIENTLSDGDAFMPSDVLRESFYGALQQYPILAGYLRRKSWSKMEIEVDKDDLNMPEYVESASDVHFKSLRDHQFHRDAWPRGVNIVDPRAIPDSSGSPKLLRAHVYRLAENSGVVIVVRASHSVFDAKGYVSFINAWAQLCRESLDPNLPRTPVKPLIDRSVLYEQLPADVRPTSSPATSARAWLTPILSIFVRLALNLYVMVAPKQAAPDFIESHLFRISGDSLRRLRDKISALEPNSPHVSNNDIITALFTMAFAQSTEQLAVQASANAGFFSKAVKYSKDLMGSGEKGISAIVPCDFRHRIGVPENYTGSCAMGLYVTAPKELLLKPITPESLAKVAVISRNTIDQVDKKRIEQFISRALKVINLVGHKANVLYSMLVCQAFSNQSRLRFYDADFGHGQPAKVVPMAYSNTVAVVFPPAPPSSDDVEVFLTLRPNVMANLLKKQDLQSFATIVY